MGEKVGLFESVELTPEDVSQEVDHLMVEILDVYAENDRFRVEDGRKNGSGTVTVWINYARVSDFQPYQVIEYDNDIVTQVTSDWGGRQYRYDQERREVHMWTSESSHGNARYHTVDCRISPEMQLLNETTRIQTCAGLAVEYHSAVQDGVQGFRSGKVQYNGLPLLQEDVEKFLPGGRFIPLSRLLQFVINSVQQYPISTQRVRAINRTDNFMGLKHFDARAHAMIWLSDVDNLGGCAHPLEEDPDGWLVFARFGNGESEVGRALIVTIDRGSVQVEDVEGIPTINARLSIDGEQFQVVIPKVLGRWEDVTDENREGALDTWVNEDGAVERICRQVTCEELAADVERGDYFGDMLNAALGAYYEKYYSSGGVDV